MPILLALYGSALTAIVLLADTGGLQSQLLFLRGVPMGDKMVHFVLAGGLSLLANVALVQRWPSRRGLAVVIASLVVMLGTTVEECTNYFSPHRGLSSADVVANCLGALCLGTLPVLMWLAIRAAWSPRHIAS